MGGGGGQPVKYLLPCWCICEFGLFYMENDHVLKKFKFDLLILTSWVWDKIFASMLLHSVIHIHWICNMTIL